MALLIYSPGKHEIALRIAKELSTWKADTIQLEAQPPASRPALIMPLLDEELIAAWEESSLGEWAMEATEDEEVRLIPVLIEDCGWNESLFFGLPLLPHARVPVQSPRFWDESEALTQLRTDLEKEYLPPEAIKKGGFKRAALRLMWYSVPVRWKWTIAILFAVLALILTVLIQNT